MAATAVATRARRHRLVLLPVLVAAASAAASVNPVGLEPERPCAVEGTARGLPFCDPSLPIDERIEDLLGRLTIDEKISLIVNDAAAVESQGLPAYNWWSEALHGIGTSPGVNFAAPTSAATSFPQVVTTSHAFNPALVHAIGGAIATEARVFNNHGKHAGLTYWAPNINIFRDPRWGRGQETPGEDPFWSGEYAAAFVRGMQEGEDARYLKASACCKHFAAYSVENLYNGTHRHNFNAHVTAQDLADTYLPAFHACVAKGRASGIMCSYNAINGVPACADQDLLNGLARGEWAFDGYVTSDCNAVSDIWDHHNYTQTPEETCGVALRAGTDLDCSSFYKEHAAAALAGGEATEGDVDAALRHLFRVQFRLGMFDPRDAQVYTQYGLDMLNSADHQALALKAARQGIVLLKNEAQALPLTPDNSGRRRRRRSADGQDEDGETEGLAVERRLRRHRHDHHHHRGGGGWVPRDGGDGVGTVAVVGPHGNATEAMLGNYFGIPPFIVSPLQGIQHFADDVRFAPGCAAVNASDPALFKQAVAAASRADVVVLALGIDRSIEDEGKDRRSIALPAPQLELAEAVLTAAEARGTPVVLVLLAGGSVDLSPFAEDPRVPAILFAGYPGQSGGQAIAEVLFGTVSPSGRLAQTFYPQAFAEAVEMGDMRMRPDPNPNPNPNNSSYPGRTYRFYRGPAPVVYPFGHGLSYARLRLRAMDGCDAESEADRRTGGRRDNGGGGAGVRSVRLTTAGLDAPDEPVLARVCLQATSLGPVTSRHTLLGFLVPPGAGQDGRPLKTLRAFGGVTLAPGDVVLAEMAFTAADFSLADAEGNWAVVPGQWALSMGDVTVPVTVM